MHTSDRTMVPRVAQALEHDWEKVFCGKGFSDETSL
jgi:hypothetical protein